MLLVFSISGDYLSYPYAPIAASYFLTFEDKLSFG